MRTKRVNGKPVSFTPEQEIARDAEEQAFATAPPKTREPARIEIIEDALLTNAIVTQAQLDTAKTKLTK